MHAFDKGTRAKVIDIRDHELRVAGKLSFRVTVAGEKKMSTVVSPGQTLLPTKEEPPKDSLDSLVPAAFEPVGRLRVSSIIGNLREEYPDSQVKLTLMSLSKSTEAVRRRGRFPVWMNVIDFEYKGEEKLQVSLSSESREVASGTASLLGLRRGQHATGQSVVLKDEGQHHAGELFLDLKFIPESGPTAILPHVSTSSILRHSPPTIKALSLIHI